MKDIVLVSFRSVFILLVVMNSLAYSSSDFKICVPSKFIGHLQLENYQSLLLKRLICCLSAADKHFFKVNNKSSSSKCIVVCR